MKHFIFARHDLAASPGDCSDRAVLLEGSWPDRPSASAWQSLDDAIDARFEWIDREAARLADRLGERSRRIGDSDSRFALANPAWLNVLALRYYLVKLIRTVAFFTEVRPLEQGQAVELFVAKNRDEDYADLLTELCRAAEATCRIDWSDRPRGPTSDFPVNGIWRRWAGRIAQSIEPRRNPHASRPVAVLSGNPRLLEPVCRELLARDWAVWWLVDRFAAKLWLRTRRLGVGQLVCESSRGRVSRLRLSGLEPIACRGVDLTRPVARWLGQRLREHGQRQTRVVERIDAHFQRIRPDALILDEDATPFARAAVAVGRTHGITSSVVQHGAPCCRFGYAPLAADRIFAWGQSSESQLLRWGVPAERIRVTGSPKHDRLDELAGYKPDRKPRVLLLTTTPPRDGRPDAVALHLNRRTYAQMIHRAAATVARRKAELVVKLHPRAGDDPVVRAVLADFPSLESRVVGDKPLEQCLAQCDCALSCMSSSGVEAAMAGIPVIQLLPPNSGDILPHDAWGMLGTARSESELDRLLAAAFRVGRSAKSTPDTRVFGNLDRPASQQIAAALLESLTRPTLRRAA